MQTGGEHVCHGRNLGCSGRLRGPTAAEAERRLTLEKLQGLDCCLRSLHHQQTLPTPTKNPSRKCRRRRRRGRSSRWCSSAAAASAGTSSATSSPADRCTPARLPPYHPRFPLPSPIGWCSDQLTLATDDRASPSGWWASPTVPPCSSPTTFTPTASMTRSSPTSAPPSPRARPYPPCLPEVRH